MKHAIERRELKQPLHEYMVRSVNVGKAAATLNDMLHEREVSPQRERTAVEIWRKLVPSMAAVAVEHHVEGPQSVHDLNAMLLSSGLEPIDNTEENVIDAVSDSDPGTPPDSDT